MSSIAQKIIVVLGVLLILFGIRYVLAKSSVSSGVRNPGPIWIHFIFEIPIYVCPTLVAIYFFDVRDLWIFSGVGNDDFYRASLWLIYGVLAYCFSFLLIDRIFKPRSASYRRENYSYMCVSISLVQILVLAMITYFVKSLPILGIFSGEDIRVLRNLATTNFDGPVYLISIERIFAYMGMAYAGVLLGRKNKGGAIYGLLITSSMGLMWSGAKSPLAIGVLIFYFARIWASGEKVNPGKALKIVLLVGGIAFLMFVIAMRGQNLSDVATYFSIRLFLGQISGYYQAYALVNPDPKYVISWIPVASMFYSNIPSFSRDLMVSTEGVTDTNGLKNSFFMHEAYGTLGDFGLIVSPFIVAIIVVIGLRLFRRMFSGLVGRDFGDATMFVVVMCCSLTGGFSGFPFFRNIITPFFLLLVPALVYRIVFVAIGRRND